MVYDPEKERLISLLPPIPRNKGAAVGQTVSPNVFGGGRPQMAMAVPDALGALNEAEAEGAASDRGAPKAGPAPQRNVQLRDFDFAAAEQSDWQLGPAPELEGPPAPPEPIDLGTIGGPTDLGTIGAQKYRAGPAPTRYEERDGKWVPVYDLGNIGR